jgi:Arc/MetJ-type ribon-helix-helix transcriptional regulator
LPSGNRRGGYLGHKNSATIALLLVCCYTVIMLKNEKASKTTQKFYSMTPKVLEKLDEIIEIDGFTSASEAIRAAVMQYHRKNIEPPYRKETAAGERKKMEVEEEKAFAAITPEEYVEEVVHAPIYEATTGQKFVVVHYIANSYMGYPLETIKDTFSDSPSILEFHLKTLEEKGTVEDNLSHYSKSLLKSRYNIVLQ